MTNKITDPELNEKLEKSHDKMPYERYPFAYTRPEHLHTLGTLFGMKPANIETARILELGSANGSNLINFAANYPKSYSLGVDLSKVEIDSGVKRIKELGLKNIELKNVAIADVDEYFGKFDYIICHGVFSWVPKFGRDKITEISKKLLNKDGIAYISYNTLPGWNMVNTIRDMMMFHSEIFEDTTSKVQQARLFLDFVNEALEGSNSPHAKFLKQEAEVLSKHQDHYLSNEYLAEENIQFYFHDFIDMVKKEGLQYLAESNVHSMFIGNLPAKAVDKLKTVNDIVCVEQYMDFIQNKRFRCTLLCHDDVQLNRNITPENLADLYMTCNLFPQKLEKDVDLSNALEGLTYYLNDLKDNHVSTSSPAMKAIFYTYHENMGNPLKPMDVINLAHKKLPKFTISELKTEFFNSIPRLIFSGVIKLFATPPKAIHTISDKPKVTDLCRYQIKNCAQNKFWVTNQINEIFAMELYEKFVLESLDGNHNRAQLEETLVAKFTSGELVASENNNRITDPAAFKDLAIKCVESSLNRFKVNYILVG